MTPARPRDAVRTIVWAALLVALVIAFFNAPEARESDVRLAYVGPGAGFAFLGSFLSILVAFILGAASVLLWPFRILWRVLTRRQGFKRAKIRKLIFLGLDGFDPDTAERYMNEGKLPNLAKLREEGIFRRLRTTYPPLSPVAWASFATGVNPAKHSLYDFLNRSIKTYVPELSSSRVTGPHRVWKIGRWQIPLSKGAVEMRRKSKPFWTILGEHHVGSTVIRVPITFPPEKFNGKLLSAMCTPDLLGTQGSFQHFTTAGERTEFDTGNRFKLQQDGDLLRGSIEGPPSPVRGGSEPMRIPFTLQCDAARNSATVVLDGETIELKVGEYSEWLPLTFRGGLGMKVRGIGRFRVTEITPEVSLYLTPINLDPEHPALPISHPSYYSAYLAKLLGPYATLGLAEDTWALNERVIDEQAFLDQAYDIFAERESMFFNALAKTKQGVVACVFDTSDRVQHMFYRYSEPDHPAHGRNVNGDYAEQMSKFGGVIEELYCRMDELVGKTLPYVKDDTLLVVLSDHGFKSFQRGVNLNAWLLSNGYLFLREGASPTEPYLRAVDWSRTRAYTFGLTGVYLNVKGREAQGVVARGEEEAAVKREIAEKLTGLPDEERGTTSIVKAYLNEEIYKGPYMGASPDIVIGYNNGYRSSWDAALGRVGEAVFEDNRKAWSGDHCVDPSLVPGVIFSNRKFASEDPGIEDLAPTTLRLFGFDPPAYMDGKDLGVNLNGKTAG